MLQQVLTAIVDRTL